MCRDYARTEHRRRRGRDQGIWQVVALCAMEDAKRIAITGLQ
jgi:hypothetical protein